MWLIIIPALALAAYAFRNSKIEQSLWTSLKVHSPFAFHSTALATSGSATHAVSAAAAPSLASAVAQSGPAKDAANTLYAYLKANGTGKNDQLTQLVISFQAQANADHNSQTLTGALLSGGIYDTATSAALSVYTHDPIAASLDAPPPPPTPTDDMSKPGSAAESGFNLYTYLKAHGNDKSPALTPLVRQFQTDVNTDPKFPGPANATGLPSSVKAPLTVSGTYDAATAAALAVGTGDKINP